MLCPDTTEYHHQTQGTREEVQPDDKAAKKEPEEAAQRARHKKRGERCNIRPRSPGIVQAQPWGFHPSEIPYIYELINKDKTGTLHADNNNQQTQQVSDLDNPKGLGLCPSPFYRVRHKDTRNKTKRTRKKDKAQAKEEPKSTKKQAQEAEKAPKTKIFS